MRPRERLLGRGHLRGGDVDLVAPAGRITGLREARAEMLRQWSIRINKQWRICFAWRTVSIKQPDGTTVEVGQLYDVEIVDYH